MDPTCIIKNNNLNFSSSFILSNISSTLSPISQSNGLLISSSIFIDTEDSVNEISTYVRISNFTVENIHNFERPLLTFLGSKPTFIELDNFTGK